MSDADEAYRIAEARIEEARRTGATVLSLSPDLDEAGEPHPSHTPSLAALDRLPSQIEALADLKGLYFPNTQVTDLAPLAAMTWMEELVLGGRRLTNLAPLSAMTEMKTLHLDATQVADLAPLAAMTGMVKLDCWSERVDPLALVDEGAAWADEDRELKTLFINPAALADEKLTALAKNHDNAPAILARLRELRDISRRPEPPPPEPAPEDWTFAAASDGRLALSDAGLADDADQTILQRELADMARGLARALAGSNEFADVAEAASAYADLLDNDPAAIGARRVWTLANRFRLLSDAQEASEALGRLSDLLPPAARAALEGLAANGGVWLLGHPGAAEVEAAARAYLARPGAGMLADAAAPIVDAAAASPEAVDPDAVAPAEELRRQHEVGGPIGALADGPLVGWAQGFVGAALRILKGAVRWTGRAYVWAGDVSRSTLALGGMLLLAEAPIRAFVAQWAPQATPYLTKLIDLLKAAVS